MDADANFIAGRVEALTIVISTLISDLEVRELLDGKRYTAAVRRHAKELRGELPHLKETKWVLNRMMDQIDDARANRKKSKRQTGSPTR